jgi:serine/threonine protein kinase
VLGADVTERLQRVEALYHAALARPAGERERFLAEQCGADNDLRREVESLLAHADPADEFLEEPALEPKPPRRARVRPGESLGHYQILDLIGVGGIGEVYRARDSRLGRMVAIKVLTEEVANDRKFRARFDREARTIARLAHSHICTLHDIGHDQGIEFLVLEYLEGDTLASRLVDGALPVSEAVAITLQIAEALDAAHRHGVIHRDLKPGNVMLVKGARDRTTSAPLAKLLDFGLAKRVPAAMIVDTPTLDRSSAEPLTVPGTLLGTFQYMAPEQLSGQPVDARADIWALGCVLHEMLAGTPAFDGASQASLISEIVDGEPAVLTPPPGRRIPVELARIVRRCLAKAPEARFQSAGDLAFALSSPTLFTGDSDRRHAADPHGARGRRWFLLAAAAALAILTLLILMWSPWSRETEPRRPQVLEIQPPPNTEFDATSGATSSPAASAQGPAPALSPDGRLLVFLAGRPGTPPALWLRALDGSGTSELASTSGARSPFWSPDSRRVGFFADGKVHRVEIETRVVRTIGAVPGSEGGAWAADGTILGGNASGGLWRIATDTNTAVDLLPPNASFGQQALISPWLLPGERRFLYLSLPDRGVWLGSLDGGTPEKLVWADSPAMFASGAIVFVRQQTLYAQRFDARGRALSGEPVIIARNVYRQQARAAFSISHTGLLVYRGGTNAPDPWLTLINHWTSLMAR